MTAARDRIQTLLPPRRARCALRAGIVACALALGGCSPGAPNGNNNNNANDNENDNSSTTAVWSAAFDTTESGALSSVWGSAPDDVFAVGGTRTQGEIYHYDGSIWRAHAAPQIPLLVWVYGFAADDVFVVGIGGGFAHFDGANWTRLESGTTKDLWGVWGAAADDLWIVGGSVGEGDPLILHYDGLDVEPLLAPDDDRDATALFKIWGKGRSIFAVGERGLILQYADGTWQQVPAGADADDDFVSLWGTSEDHIVAVGGRTSARIAVYDGTSWSTQKFAGTPGLNASFMVREDLAIVGGNNGFAGTFNPNSAALAQEDSGTNQAIHAAWSDGAGTAYAVGGQFREPYLGVALRRTAQQPAASAVLPQPAAGIGGQSPCVTGHELQGNVCVKIQDCPGPDADGDGVNDDCDNCPEAANANQSDKDGDGTGNACDRCSAGNDHIDTDGDGTPNACDACAGYHDALDGDSDGTPDGCDRCAAGDDDQDADGDDQPDACDTCPGHDDDRDADDDSVPDGCDLCAAGDDALDADGDDVPDACDVCPGHPDDLDTDDDGVPNGCDACSGGSASDADDDGVPDDCDLCPGFNDLADADGDGTPDGCDACAGSDDVDDADADGTPDACDVCPGQDDALDDDGDGVPDGCDACPDGDDAQDDDDDGTADDCDLCPEFDDTADADADDVPDGCDECPGFDDGVDSDGNGIPDGCCAHETDCALGLSCQDGVCVTAAGLDLELRIAGDGPSCLAGPERILRPGGILPICEGFQGFVDVYLTLRVTGLSPPTDVLITRRVDMLDAPCAAQAECPLGYFCLSGTCSPSSIFVVTRPLADAGGGVGQLVGFSFILFDNVGNLEGRPARLNITVTDPSDDRRFATLVIDLELFGSRMCDFEPCPAAQPCVEDFCQPE